LSQEGAGTAEAVQIMQMLAGAWVARIVSLAAELGLADTIGDDAKSPAAIAAGTDTDQPSMHRLLRALAAIGLLTEQTDSRYSLTPLGMVLRSDHPCSIRAWARLIMSDETVRPWKEMAYSLRTGHSAFEHVFGCDPWAYRADHPQYSTLTAVRFTKPTSAGSV
jgi:C-methyltransferase